MSACVWCLQGPTLAEALHLGHSVAFGRTISPVFCYEYAIGLTVSAQHWTVEVCSVELFPSTFMQVTHSILSPVCSTVTATPDAGQCQSVLLSSAYYLESLWPAAMVGDRLLSF